MNAFKKCPKCSGEMVQGEFLKNLPKIVAVSIKGQRSLDRVIPKYCRKCGFIEIYKELKGEIGIDLPLKEVEAAL